MRYIVVALLTIGLSSAYASQADSVIVEVAKLRQKYEECKSAQNSSKTVDVNRYNGAVAEIAQQKAVIESLEKTLQSRDRRYRELLNENEKLKVESHSAKVSRIERQNLTASLEKAKTEIERLKAISGNLKTSPKTIVQEKIVEKIVYKDRPIVEEKVVTKTVEPTDKIFALQRELDAARLTIARLKKSSNTVIQEKIVEKIVYKDRPIVQEKVVTKMVESTDKIFALQRELDAARLTIARLKKSSNTVVQEKIVEKIVYKDRPIVQEKCSERNVKPLKAPEIKSSVVKVETPAPNSKKSVSHAYRIWGNAPIYNAPGGVQVDTWEDRRSFTAGNPSNGWIHISGYFVNRVWQSTAENEDLWVRESDTIRR